MVLLEILNILCGAFLLHFIIRPFVLATVYTVRDVRRTRAEERSQ